MKSKWLITAALAASAALVPAASPNLTPLENKVRHQLAMLPYYNIFDYISFRVDGGTVTLFGDVTKPVLKSDAGNAVKHVEGVERIENQIEVLPLSPLDEGIRARTARAIYAYPALSRYGAGTQPSIHIIVKNGNVTLMGFVSNDTDKQLAFIRANGVPGVFAVNNELQIQR
ncbi:MAG: BON domain-containing protein [Bryobacteraceae bacterium]|jgi:hyperosmotically inducible protein